VERVVDGNERDDLNDAFYDQHSGWQAILTTRLLHPMKRDGLKRGIVTICVGDGRGDALAVEPLDEAAK
jgi:hypothetical protein